MSLLDTTITLKEVECRLQSALGTDSQFGPACTHRQIGIGCGHSSTIIWVDADWTPTNASLPHNFVVKIPKTTPVVTESIIATEKEDTDEEAAAFARKIADFIGKAHNAEVHMYGALASESGLATLKVYYSQLQEEDQQGYMIMEAVEDAHMQQMWMHTDVTHVEQIMRAYARIHATVVKAGDAIPITHNGLAEVYGMMMNAKQMRTSIALLHSRRPDDDKEYHELIDRAVEVIPQIGDLNRLDALPQRLGITPVIVHADMHAANMIWQGNDEDYAFKAVLDWQIYHPGTIGEDLARLIFSLMAPCERRLHWQRLVELFYDEFVQHLGDVPAPYTKEQALLSYRHCAPVMSLLLTVFLDTLQHAQTKLRGWSPSKVAEVIRVMDEKIIGNMQDMILFYTENQTLTY